MDAVTYLPYITLKNNQYMNLAMGKSLDNDGKYITLSLNPLYGNCMAIASNRAIANAWQMHGQGIIRSLNSTHGKRMANAWPMHHSEPQSNA